MFLHIAELSNCALNCEYNRFMLGFRILFCVGKYVKYIQYTFIHKHIVYVHCTNLCMYNVYCTYIVDISRILHAPSKIN